MKKILLSSAVLLTTAGMATANITLDGYARLGVVHQEGVGDETTIYQRFRLNVTAQTETTNGVSVMGRIRMQADSSRRESTASGVGPGAAGYRIEKGALRLDVGNIDDLLESFELHRFAGRYVGLTGALSKGVNFVNYDKNAFDQNGGAQGAKLRYRSGDLTASAAYYFEEEGNTAEYWQAGVAYDVGAAKFAAIYGSNENFGDKRDYWILGVDGRAGDVVYSAMYGSNEFNNDDSWGISATYPLSEVTLLEMVVSEGGSNDKEELKTTYGAGFVHDLGGGTSLRGAAGYRGHGQNLHAELGLRFNF